MSKSKFTTVKSPKEIKKMKQGGKILYKILHQIGAAAKPGVTPNELNDLAHKLCKDYNVKPCFYKLYGFPGAICSSVNDAVVHGIPDDIPLKEGDVFKPDFGVEHKGFMTDSAYSFRVGKVDPEVEKFLQTVEKALYKAIEICGDGVRVGDIGYIIEETIESEGYSIVEELGGHGIGIKVHEEPHIYNYGKPNTLEVLREGMTIAIEPIANMGAKEVFTDSDKWTVRSKDGSIAGHFEHTLVIGAKGQPGIILTGKE